MLITTLGIVLLGHEDAAPQRYETTFLTNRGRNASWFAPHSTARSAFSCMPWLHKSGRIDPIALRCMSKSNRNRNKSMAAPITNQLFRPHKKLVYNTSELPPPNKRRNVIKPRQKGNTLQVVLTACAYSGMGTRPLPTPARSCVSAEQRW